MTKNDLRNLVLDLISSQKEDTFYDFKQEWHKNNANLIKDIICLANCNHNGNRYLIIGVNEEDYSIIDIKEDANRKTQANIIDLLRSSSFAGGNSPSILLETIEINNKHIDIIIIENKQEKPYYLTETYSNNKKYVYAGAIYTRNKDTNTPNNQTASTLDVENMWKERFGLTLSIRDKFKLYLQDYENWRNSIVFYEIEDNKYDKFYYEKFPEFQIHNLYEDSINRTYTGWLSCLKAFSKIYHPYKQHVKEGSFAYVWF